MQVIDEAAGEVVYTLRINGRAFRPKVFEHGSYTVRVGEPGTPRLKVLKRVKSLPPGKTETVAVRL